MFLNSRRFSALAINALLMLAIAEAKQNNPSPASQQDSQAPAAQPDPAEQKRWQQQRRFNAFAQALKLSPQQRWQVAQIQKDSGQSISVVRHDDSLTEEQKQQKIRQIRTEQHQKITAVLSPEQQEALKKWTDEQKQKQSAKNSPVSSASADQVKSHDKTVTDDDFFAGMTQDPEPPAQTQSQLPKGRKN